MGDDDRQEKLKHHINECVNSYTTYILVDKVSNGDFYASSSDKTRTNDKTRNKDHKSSRIVTVMICEKYVHVERQHHHCCLIHYLCTYPSMRERGYASTLMKCVFQEEGELYNKKNYCVT